LYNAALYLLIACGSDRASLPDDERAISTLDEGETARVCDEIERITIDDPAYARGVCTQEAAQVTASDPTLSCEEVADVCVGDFPGISRATLPCPLPSEPYKTACGALEVGEILRCMPAIKADLMAHYANASCSDPSAAKIEPADERLARLSAMPPPGCEALVAKCPRWFMRQP
jgi:hypothetical protein